MASFVGGCFPCQLLFRQPFGSRPYKTRTQGTVVDQVKRRISYPFALEHDSSGTHYALPHTLFSTIQSFLGTPPSLRVITYEDDPFTWDFSARFNGDRHPQILHGHKDYVITVVARGSLLVTGSNDGTAKVWDAGGGALKQTLRCDSAVCALAIAIDTIVTGTRSGLVESWKDAAWSEDSAVCEELDLCEPEPASPEPRRISYFQSRWHFQTGATVLTMALRSDILLTGGRDKKVRVWNTLTGRLQQVFTMHRSVIWAVAIHRNVNMATSASGDGSIYLWNTFHGNVVHKLEEKECCMDCPSSQYLEAWRRALVQRIDPCVAVDMDGDLIVTGSAHGVVRVWNRKSGMLIRTLNRRSCMCPLGCRNALVVQADGRVVTCWRSGFVDIWDVNYDSPQFTITSGFPAFRNPAQSYAISVLN